MGNAIYWQLLKAQVRSQTTYRTSFVLDLIFTTLVTSVEIVAIVLLFRINDRFGGIALPEAMLVAGIAALSFGLADLAVGNIERVPHYIRTGLLDAVLVRPLGALSQLLVIDFAPRRVGRVIQGAAVMIGALAWVDMHWTPAKAALIVAAPLAGAVTFASIFVIGSAWMFWLVEGGEVANAFIYGGRDFSSYPTSVFGGWFRRFFGYALALAFVAYLPAMALMDRPDPLGLPDWARWCSPLTAALWAAAASWFWKFGVRHYRSTGS